VIEVVLEDPELAYWGLENCCICEQPTPYWYIPNDVACCQGCAKDADPAKMPTKKEWVAKERAKEKR
jgi:hypothetical protein